MRGSGRILEDRSTWERIEFGGIGDRRSRRKNQEEKGDESPPGDRSFREEMKIESGFGQGRDLGCRGNLTVSERRKK